MKTKILIADDDESVRKMIARVLESCDYAVSLARDGEEAMNRLQTEPLDLVLLDLNMPEQSGWKVLNFLSQFAPTVPVIMLSAWPDQTKQALERGMRALMQKPLDMAELLRIIGDLLLKSAERAAPQAQTAFA